MRQCKGFDFTNIVKNFNFNGEFVKAEPYGFGHINDTFAAYFTVENASMHRYILQRINHSIFKSPENLMKNIEGITKHLRKAIIEEGGDPLRETLNVISTNEGKSFYVDNEGNYWRSYIFIEGAKTYQVVEKPEHFYNSGRAFGKFEKLLSNYLASTLYETIPDFHNTEVRFDSFIEAVEGDVMNRAKGVKAEIDFALKRVNDTGVITNLLRKNLMPVRVTHNDTKFNNVMIDDETGEGICVIDLDTVMPGSLLYDFGDAIRFGTNPAEEDEQDLPKVWMEIELFEEFTRGFLEASRGTLTQIELDYMPFSAKIMTYECGIRFLTDYLNGDKYFKVHREGHNLDRTRTQFKLVADMEIKFYRMKEIVRNYSLLYR